MPICKYCGASIRYVGRRKGGEYNICDLNPVYVGIWNDKKKAKVYVNPFGALVLGEKNSKGDKCYMLHNCKGQADFAYDPFGIKKKKEIEEKAKVKFKKDYMRVKGEGAKQGSRNYNIEQLSFL